MQTDTLKCTLLAINSTLAVKETLLHRDEVETEITNRRNKTERRGKKLPSQVELYKYHQKDNKKRFHLEATDVFPSKKISPTK